jgi:uncharacterized protein (DUF427 family)
MRREPAATIRTFLARQFLARAEGRDDGPGSLHVIRATWNGAVLAEADTTVVVEGNHYFPPETVDFDHLRLTQARSLCVWKGMARYYDAVVDGDVNRGAGWTYRHPSPLARRIRDYVAFWNGVVVEEMRDPRGATA